jgi:serine phosphatase RsbU (regulator of sigma subunit)
MGQLRTVARASATEGHTASEILAALNRYLERLGSELLTTAVVVRLDAVTGAASVASAGHLPPLVVEPTDNGWKASDLQLEVGPPLGLGETWPERTSALPADAVLLLYTDGLVESRRWPLDHGLDLLRKAVESLPPEADLGAFLDAALELVPTGSRGDDVAILGALTPPAR